MAGGECNTASGSRSVVSGGGFNTAGGSYSFAVGNEGVATHDNAAVLAFSSTGPCSSANDGEVRVCTDNGFFINDVDAEALLLALLPRRRKLADASEPGAATTRVEELEEVVVEQQDRIEQLENSLEDLATMVEMFRKNLEAL